MTQPGICFAATSSLSGKESFGTKGATVSKVNARSYFAKLAEQGATHSIRLAKAHAARHAVLTKGKALFSKAAKADGMDNFSDVSDWIDELVEQEAEMRDANTDAGEFFAECMKACKAMGDDDLGKSFGMSDRRGLMPDEVSGVVPDMPLNVRAVPRFGQREIGELQPVAPGFEKLVEIPD
jgi:hypothetical protein